MSLLSAKVFGYIFIPAAGDSLNPEVIPIEVFRIAPEKLMYGEQIEKINPDDDPPNLNPFEGWQGVPFKH